MARGTTLGRLVVMLREECGHATSAALSVNQEPHMKRVLARIQETLWNDHDWEHLKIRRDENLAAGQRYYSFPVDLAFERISALKVEVKYNENWTPIDYGIGAEQYNISNPDTDDRSSPVTRWRHYAGEEGEDASDQYEIWPVPDADDQQVLRFNGIRKLPPLIANTDRAALDDNLIVLFAAVEFLEEDEAKKKQAAAQQLYVRLRGQHNKGGTIIMGGGHDPNMTRFRPPAPLYGRKVT